MEVAGGYPPLHDPAAKVKLILLISAIQYLSGGGDSGFKRAVHIALGGDTGMFTGKEQLPVELRLPLRAVDPPVLTRMEAGVRTAGQRRAIPIVNSGAGEIAFTSVKQIRQIG